ncbi:hypothetical protein BLX24_25385 [Arsenicibacter rosenii]|uniref:C-methyltransferase domain-containing protein n=2 Tax=Arsenicibacter rosenii TaxID=1750698 RepID=A0A1S2VCC2_9BACT|nr:hypothetical protein BLX24_25385 [Arsenicibacter rosenii]
MKNDYLVLYCSKCGFIFGDIGVDQFQLDNYYSQLSKYEDENTVSVGAGGISLLDQTRLKDTVEIISAHIDKNAKILDVGCANGGLLKAFKNKNFSNLFGLDPSPTCSRRASQLVDCECLTGSIFDFDFRNEFDLITYTHVLEHIYSINEIIVKSKQAITEDGLIYIECPDAESYHINIHSPLQEFNTEHINHFSTQDFINIGKLYDLRIEEIGVRSFKIENGLDYFAAYVIYSKKKLPDQFYFQKSTKNLLSVNEYIYRSKKSLNTFSEYLNKINDKVCFYGIGQLAYKLIALAQKQNKQLLLFDGDKRNVGETISGVKIEIGSAIYDDINTSEDLVIITSAISFQRIRKDIIELYKAKNTVCPRLVNISDLFTE